MSWTLFLVLVAILVSSVLGIVVVSSLLVHPRDGHEPREGLTARSKRAGGDNLLPTDRATEDAVEEGGTDEMKLGPTD